MKIQSLLKNNTNLANEKIVNFGNKNLEGRKEVIYNTVIILFWDNVMT